MSTDHIRSGLEQAKSTLVSEAMLGKMESQIEGCENCNTSSETRFGAMLNFFVGEPVKRYSLERPAKCPFCKARLDEMTLVDWK